MEAFPSINKSVNKSHVWVNEHLSPLSRGLASKEKSARRMKSMLGFSVFKIFSPYQSQVFYLKWLFSNSLDQLTDLSLAYSMWQGPQPGVLFNSSKCVWYFYIQLWCSPKAAEIKIFDCGPSWPPWPTWPTWPWPIKFFRIVMSGQFCTLEMFLLIEIPCYSWWLALPVPVRKCKRRWIGPNS